MPPAIQWTLFKTNHSLTLLIAPATATNSWEIAGSSWLKPPSSMPRWSGSTKASWLPFPAWISFRGRAPRLLRRFGHFHAGATIMELV